MKIEGDRIILDSGRELSANCGIVGLSPDGGVYGGYDDCVFVPEPSWDDEGPSLSPEERVELARFMIGRWEAFLERAEQEIGPFFGPILLTPDAQLQQKREDFARESFKLLDAD